MLFTMVFTRLLNLSTMTLEEFDIDQMPEYFAISHVWSESIFPVSNLADLKVGMCDGIEMLRVVRETDEELARTHYCWIDTWCIDQNDSEDKHRQIPMMGKVYKNANVVVVTVKHKFTFTQSYWNELVHSLGIPFGLVRDPNTCNIIETRNYLRTAQFIDNVEKACEVLREFRNLEWMKRVWTAQEYILARRLVYIGGDLRPFTLLWHDMWVVIFLHDWIVIIPWKSDLGTCRYLKLCVPCVVDLTLAMGLALYRKAFYVEDEICGMMAASQVVMTPANNATLEGIWSVKP
jgi:hypothetical protein